MNNDNNNNQAFQLLDPYSYDLYFKGVLVGRFNLHELQQLFDLLHSRLQQQQPAVGTVIKVISDYYQVPVETICSKARYNSAVWPRQLAIVLASEFFSSLSRKTLTSAFGRSETAMTWARNAVGAYIRTKDGKAEVEKIRALVRKALLSPTTGIAG